MFLIDTGASMHVLASWFVNAANIKSQSSAGTARGTEDRWIAITPTAGAARAGIGPAGVKSLPEAHVCINKDSEFKNRSYAIPITAEGAKALLIVDSGATGSVIAAETQIAKALDSRAIEGNHTQGLGGAVDANRHVPGVEILRGDTAPDPSFDGIG